MTRDTHKLPLPTEKSKLINLKQRVCVSYKKMPTLKITAIHINKLIINT